MRKAILWASLVLSLILFASARAATTVWIPNTPNDSDRNKIEYTIQGGGTTLLSTAGVSGGVNAQTGTTYTFLTTDDDKLVTFNNGSAVAVTLPAATTAGFGLGFQTCSANLGAGLVTITPTTSLIDGNATDTVPTKGSRCIYSDGTNYNTTGRLPSPSTTTLGGVNSKASASNQFLTQIGTDGSISAAQPSASNLSDGTTGSGGAVVLATGPTISSPTVNASPLTISGNQSVAAWTTNGTGLKIPAQTYTDTTSSGTVAESTAHNIGAPTFAASSATTYTTGDTLRIAGAPINGSNVTVTNGFSLNVVAGPSRFGGLVTAAAGITVSAGQTTQVNSTTVNMPNLTQTSAAQTGVVCSGASGILTVDTTTICTTSSIRFKERIANLTAGLAEVMQWRPVSYYYKDAFNGATFRNNPNYNGEQVGFIAEEIHAIDPRLTTVEKDGQIHSVRYTQMTAVLTKAVQEQQREIMLLICWCALLSGTVLFLLFTRNYGRKK